MVKIQPRLTDLFALIDKVPGYPVSSEELVELAIEEGSDFTVEEFYRSFPSGQDFKTIDELQARSEQVALMNQDEPNQPYENWLAPEED
ncbi:hypothetical protein H0X09_00695 [Candidatus Saccharibacteria bacterium]|nr:hypothetical protein [Candidatus Saccharibacteria bacterium]